MSLAADLRTFLLADAGILALVGANGIQVTELLQNADLPAITMQSTGTEHIHDLDGSAGAAEATVQLTAWAATMVAAKALAELVRLRIQGKQTTMGSTVVKGILLPTDREIFSSDPRRFGIEADYQVWYSESIPP